MEEILASIRRIISEDETEGEEGAMQSDTVEEAEAGVASEAEVEEEALELTQMVEDDGTVVDLNAEKETASDLIDPEPEEAAAAEPELPSVDEAVEEQAVELAADGEEDSETALEFEPEEEPEPVPVALELDDVASADVEPFNKSEEVAVEAPTPTEDPEGLVSQATALAATAAMANLTRMANDERGTVAPTVSDITVVALARQAIEPYLKAWLDENLAPLVERVVREEVKKMARRAEDR